MKNIYSTLFIFAVFGLLSIPLSAQSPSCDSLANFTWNAQCNSVQFTPTFVQPGATYSWSFGDGSTSNSVSPAHIYHTPANAQYTVRLIAAAAGCPADTFTTTVPVTIPAGGLPVASMVSLGVGTVLQDNFLNCLSSNVNPNFTLFVQNSSTNSSPNSMYLINWGDGTPSTMPSTFGTISHTYNAMGLFPIILEVKNPNGCVDTAQYEFFNGREPGAGIGIPTSANLCAPIEITFIHPLEVAEQNPPGTIYIYEVETGCEPLFTDTLPHTNPFTPFVYTFSRGSCEPDCLLPDPHEGQFVVTMTASNACGVTSVSVLPRIFKMGDADFQMPEQAVVGDTVCMINTSETSYWWNQFSQECVTDMSKFWTITPSAGYTVLDGALGMAPITTGTDTVCIRFTAQGVYTVKFVYDPPAPNPCAADTITKTISVSTVSTLDTSLEQQITIMPNPAGGRCRLQVPSALQVQSCVVYDLLGTRLFEQAFDRPPYVLDLSDRAAGIYLLHIILKDGRSAVKKIVN